MAKIRQSAVFGDLGRYDYEVHYNAKSSRFEAKKYPDHLTAFINGGKITANSENKLEDEFRSVVKRYEGTQQNWELYIVFKLVTTNGEDTLMNYHGSSYYQKSIQLDYDLAYYNQVGEDVYYITKKEWDFTEELGHKPSPRHARYGDYAVSKNSINRIKHTPELEQFFTSMTQSMGILIDKVKAVLNDENKIFELATAQTKLIG